MDALITEPMNVAIVLVVTLALLFWLDTLPAGKKFFKIIPLLVFAYFVPTLLSNTGVIPLESEAYDFIKSWLLPASLFLLTLSVDIPSILKLGPKTLVMFFGATLSIALGGPLVYLLGAKLILPASLGEEAWKGMAALCGSWIGATANYIAMGENFGASDATMSAMVVPDVFCSNLWVACLFYFAGREKEMDQKIGADRSTLDALQKKLEAFRSEVERPTNLRELLVILALGFGVSLLAYKVSPFMPTISLPKIGSIISGFTWTVLLVTFAGVSASFTKLRRLEGAGASTIGTVFLYLLVTSIGAKGDFMKVIEAPHMVVLCTFWIAFHGVVMLLLRRLTKSPIFLLAVASQANIGGAASAPIVASAFNPALAPVGVLLAIFGYAVGNVAGLLCGVLLKLSYMWLQYPPPL